VRTQQIADQSLHPAWEHSEPGAQVAAESSAVLIVGQQRRELGHDSVAVAGQRVLEPMERLHDSHGGTPRPVQPAGRGLLELDDQVVQPDRSASRVCVNDDACWYRGGQAEIVGGGHPVDERAYLVPPPNRVDDSTVVGHYWLLCQPVYTRDVIEAAVDASEVSLLNESLQNFVNRGAATEVEEVDGRPDLTRRTFGNAGSHRLRQVPHPIFVHKFRTLWQRSAAASMAALFGQKLCPKLCPNVLKKWPFETNASDRNVRN
jgi:hypothetical protein